MSNGNIRRPDTGTQRNMIMEMAASIMASKAKQNRMIADMMRDKPERADTVAILDSQANEMDRAIELIDKLAGSWN